jgi:PAS domain S-box-containing protein
VVACMPDITEHRQAKADLREREHLLDVFIDHMPAAIAMLDKDMRYIFTSRSWCRDFGAGIETFTGRSHYELYPELPERCRTILRRALGGATERGEREPFPRQDGSLDWVTWEVRPWREADGTLGGLIIEAELLARLPALPPGLS